MTCRECKTDRSYPSARLVKSGQVEWTCPMCGRIWVAPEHEITRVHQGVQELMASDGGAETWLYTTSGVPAMAGMDDWGEAWDR